MLKHVRITMALNAPGSVGRDRYADILAFVLKSNGFPAGHRDLDRRSEFLTTIAFEAASTSVASEKSGPPPPCLTHRRQSRVQRQSL